MPLSTAQPVLILAIKDAFNKSKKAGEIDGASPDLIISLLASELADAIHQYVMSATVTTTVVTPTDAGTGTGKLS